MSENIRIEKRTVNLYSKYITTIPLVQNNTTVLEFTLTVHGEPFVPDNVVLNAVRSDNTLVTQVYGIAIDGNLLKIKLDPRIVDISGKVEIELKFPNNAEMISSYKFNAVVSESLVNGQDLSPPASDINAIMNLYASAPQIDTATENWILYNKETGETEVTDHFSKGDKGDRGEQGVQGIKGDSGDIDAIEIYRSTANAITGTTPQGKTLTITDINPNGTPPVSFIMYGETTQATVPAPTIHNPVPLISVTDPTISFGSETVTFAGLALHSNNNIRDTLEWKNDRLILTEKNEYHLYDGNEAWYDMDYNPPEGLTRYYLRDAQLPSATTVTNKIHKLSIAAQYTGTASMSNWYELNHSYVHSYNTANGWLGVCVSKTEFPNVTAYKARLAQLYNAGTPVAYCIDRKTPVVTDITNQYPTQAAQLRNLRMQKPVTITANGEITVTYNKDLQVVIADILSRLH